MQFPFFYLSFSMAWLGIGLIVAGDGGSPTTHPTSNALVPCESIISLDKPSFQPGEAVYLSLTTINRPGHKTVLSRPEATPIFVVTLEGKPVEYTRFGKMLEQERDHYDGSNHLAMEDNESRTERFLLSRLVDLTLGGHYEVRVERRVGDVGNPEPFPYVIESNRIAFEIKG